MPHPNSNTTRPDIVVLACSRALTAEKTDISSDFKLVRMPCSSKVEPSVVLRAFEGGAKGVLLVPCVANACQYVEGNFRARSMAKGTMELMSEVGLDPQRFAVYPLEMSERSGIEPYLQKFADRIKTLGDWL